MPFSALTLLVVQQKGYVACKGCAQTIPIYSGLITEKLANQTKC